MTDSNIKLGVSFHTFVNEYCSAKWSLEDMMELSSFLGGGIEIVGPSHQRGFPYLSPDFERRFKSNLERFDLTPVCYGSYADPFVFADRPRTEDELYQYTLPQLHSAAKLGFKLVRLQYFTHPIAERLLPHADKLGLQMGYELHSPLTFESQSTQMLIEQIEKLNTPLLGLIPDCGIFASSVPTLHVNAALQRGVSKVIVDYAIALWNDDISLHDALPKLADAGLQAKDIDVIEIFWGSAGRSDPENLKKYLKRILHIHGKYFDILNGSEPHVRYEEVIKVLKDAGYDGWLMTEYEGASDVNGFDIALKHQEMISRFLKN